ncbi:hypothetical protein D3C81_2201750 [compost metagenome]
MARAAEAGNRGRAHLRIGKSALGQFKRNLLRCDLPVVQQAAKQGRQFSAKQIGGREVDRNMLIRIVAQPFAHIFKHFLEHQSGKPGG